MIIRIERYQPCHQTIWDQFIDHSKNATFLFYRQYMNYHQDRFEDHSLLVYNKDQLIGLFPANRIGDQLYSHQGLTYGGLLTDRHMRVGLTIEFFKQLIHYCRLNKIAVLHYKAIPHIYHHYPAEEDIYALFSLGATLHKIDISTAIRLSHPLAFHKGKKYNLARARTANLEIKKSDDYEQFFSMVEKRLSERYQTKPIHTASEMRYLAERFPDNIQLFVATQGEDMLAGVIVYITPLVIHTQYISSTSRGRELFAVDYLIASLIETLATTQLFFDFGTSTEHNSGILNTGLIDFKEWFGGRSIVHQFFTLPIPMIME